MGQTIWLKVSVNPVIIRLFSYSIIGGIGWTFGGPLGGVLGFISGAVVDSIFLIKEEKKPIGIFSTNLLVLLAAVLKADMPASSSKIKLIKRFLKKNYDAKTADEAFSQLEEILRQDIPIDDACTKIRNSLDYSSCLQLAQFIYKLARIDGKITEATQLIINAIANGLGVASGNKQNTRQAISQNDAISAAYAIMGVNGSANIANIKKAYRKLAVEYHPDKVAHLGEAQKKIANENFLQLTNAYDIIKKERNFT